MSNYQTTSEKLIDIRINLVLIHVAQVQAMDAVRNEAGCTCPKHGPKALQELTALFNEELATLERAETLARRAEHEDLRLIVERKEAAQKEFAGIRKMLGVPAN